jgi:hypothetical protein
LTHLRGIRWADLPGNDNDLFSPFEPLSLPLVRLDLAFLVDAEDHGMVRRIDVEARPTRPALPMKKGRYATMARDYKCHPVRCPQYP